MGRVVAGSAGRVAGGGVAALATIAGRAMQICCGRVPFLMLVITQLLHLQTRLVSRVMEEHSVLSA
jgi:hypothetical protein